MIRIIYLLLPIFLCLTACTSETDDKPAQAGCLSCHDFRMDKHHDIGCTSCHSGSNETAIKDEAHLGLVSKPAHPDNMTKSCGQCHGQHTVQLRKSLHYTLKNSTNIFRGSFYASSSLASFQETPQATSPTNIPELADDLLRRRCFRCHLFTSGDSYPKVSRGTGCSACHLQFYEGKLKSHLFQSPADDQCLSCHYGNYVGFDYYGRFEHDFNNEYRTPYTTTQDYFKPYGVEYHELRPDIHQQKSMVCIDCHSGPELMTSGNVKPSCKGCHKKDMLKKQLPNNVTKNKADYILTARNGRKHNIPLMQDPAHSRFKEKIACQSCHAQWAYNDIGKHLLRSDTDNYDLFFNLSVQGSAEIEKIVENNNDFEKEELPLVMTDKITDKAYPGLWYKGYSYRRWESVQLGRNNDGTISVFRPLLDYSLSWIDGDDTVIYDSVPARSPQGAMKSYVPHTTGAAGLFYADRIQRFLASENPPPEE